MPRFSGDAIAPSKLGQVMAIAERLDTLAGGFAAGLRPTGNKDAFALRRNALGLARTLIEGGFDLDLQTLLANAFGIVDQSMLEVHKRAEMAKPGLKAFAQGSLSPDSRPDQNRTKKSEQVSITLQEQR